MVSLSAIQASNSLLSSALQPGLVAVFVGATSGIGESTLKQFAKHTKGPRAYLVGRSQNAANRIVQECKSLNPAGEYIFLKRDVSLLCVVDEVCKEIKAKEEAINILFLSAGIANLDRRKTSEDLHLLTALTYYSRMRLINNLLPLLRQPSGLRRVVLVGGGGKEGTVDASDFQGLRLPVTSLRAHLCTMISLGLETIAEGAPEVSFIHDFPGTVRTPIFDNIEGVRGTLFRTYLGLFGRWVCVPVEESGERHLYLATSARYPPAGGVPPVPLGDGIAVAVGTSGDVGSGVYSVGLDCESSSGAVREILAGYRGDGMKEEVWRHTEEEFKRITGKK